MNNELKTKEYLKKIEGLKLSESSRARIENNLMEYTRFHSVKTPTQEVGPGVFDGTGKRLRAYFGYNRIDHATRPVRTEGDSRSIKQVPQCTSLFSLRTTYTMPIAILIAVMIGGGTSFAAQGAVPGDFLYPVKTEVNESVRSAFTFGADAEARLQARLLEERVEETKTLKAEGRFNGEAASTAKSQVIAQSQKTFEAMEESDTGTRTDIRSRVQVALENYNTMVATESSAAIDIAGLFSAAADMATELNDEPIDVEVLRSSTKARLSNLNSVVANAQAEVNASVASELNAKLATATNLVVSAETQAETEARQTLLTAAGLLGEVEAKLTTFGTASIDSGTGAIIDIDFSNVPPQSRTEAEMRTETQTQTESGGSLNADINLDDSVEVHTNASTNSEVKTGTDDNLIDAEGSLDSTSQIRL